MKQGCSSVRGGAGGARPARNPAAAFTLVELMLALAIFTGVVAAIYSCWSSLLRSAQVSQVAAAEAQRKRIAIRCLEDVLWSAQLFNQNARHYAFLADTASDDPTLSLVAHLPRSFPRSGRFEGQPLRRVTFWLERDPTGGKVLLMRQTPILFEANADEEENPLVLAYNVSAFEVDFWGPNSREWEPEWLSTNQLPRLVRFSIGFGSPGGRLQVEDIVSRVIALPTTGVPGMPGVGQPRNLPPATGPGGGSLPPPSGSGPAFNPSRNRRP
jgi:type II secretory pathway pseudopilin PulG